MKNISFGKLEIGTTFKKQNSKEAISDFVKNNDSLTTRLSVLCDIIDENTDNDLFILEASNNKNTDYATFKLSAVPTHISKKGESIPEEIRIFKEKISMQAPQEEKSAFIQKMYTLFMDNTKRGQYSIYKLCNNCAPKNPASNLIFIATKTRVDNLLELTKGDENLSTELALTFAKIDEILKRNGKHGELTAKHSSYKESEKSIILTLLCESGKKITRSIKLEAHKEEKSEALKSFVKDIENIMSSKETSTNKKLNSLFDKYC